MKIKLVFFVPQLPISYSSSRDTTSSVPDIMRWLLYVYSLLWPPLCLRPPEQFLTLRSCPLTIEFDSLYLFSF